MITKSQLSSILSKSHISSRRAPNASLPDLQHVIEHRQVGLEVEPSKKTINSIVPSTAANTRIASSATRMSNCSRLGESEAMYRWSRAKCS
jgi:hypothetical protein